MTALHLHVVLPFLPPSSNNIYKTIPGHGRHLSSAAKQFQLKAMRVIQQEGRAALLNLKQNVPYQLHMTFFFPEVENKGWFETWTRGPKQGQRKAETRYKRIDLSNRIKLLEDTIASALGIDDCHTFRLIIEKAHDPKNPRVEVALTLMPEKGEKEDAQDKLRQAQPDRTGSTLQAGQLNECTSRTREGDAHRVTYGGMLKRGAGTRSS